MDVRAGQNTHAQETLDTAGAAAKTRALIVPQEEAVLSSQMDGIVSDVAVRVGDRFNADDRLVSFDCASQNAELQRVSAIAEGAKAQVDSNEKLAKLKSIGTLDIILSEAALKEARAEVKLRQLEVARCRIDAPFSGRVVEVEVNAHETVSQSDPLLAILNDKELEVEILIPSSWLAWFSTGQPFVLILDETGAEYRGEVARLGASIDAVSQSIKGFGTLQDDGDAPVLAGMSGTAYFEVPAPRAASGSGD